MKTYTIKGPDCTVEVGYKKGQICFISWEGTTPSNFDFAGLPKLEKELATHVFDGYILATGKPLSSYAKRKIWEQAWLKKFGKAYIYGHNDEKRLFKDLVISEKLTNTYLEVNEWWARENEKNLLNYSKNVQRVQSLIDSANQPAKPKAPKTSDGFYFPDTWELSFYQKLKKSEDIMAYWKILRDNGYVCTQNVPFIKWKKKKGVNNG